MNREIKFRVWSNNTWKMHEVVGIRFLADKIDVLDDGMPVTLETSYQGEFVLLQYTGLKDKNGKEIYEGDILQCHYDFGDDTEPMEPVIVEWQYDGWAIHALGNDIYMLPRDWEGYEVIGNVFENSDLLETNDHS